MNVFKYRKKRKSSEIKKNVPLSAVIRLGIENRRKKERMFLMYYDWRATCMAVHQGRMIDVIFVTHKSPMTIPTQIVTTPPWYAAMPDLLRVLDVPVF